MGRKCVLAHVASEPPICVSGADAGISPRIGSVDDANHWIGSTGAPPGIYVGRGSFFESLANSQAYPPIHPQNCRLPDVKLLEQPRVSCILSLCFGARKRNEAWNPGNFGCRGLLVYGSSKSCGSASPRLSRRERSGNGYLFPFAQLNRSTRSSRSTRPRLSA